MTIVALSPHRSYYGGTDVQRARAGYPGRRDRHIKIDDATPRRRRYYPVALGNPVCDGHEPALVRRLVDPF
jgi:hypothetical protein